MKAITRDTVILTCQLRDNVYVGQVSRCVSLCCFQVVCSSVVGSPSSVATPFGGAEACAATLRALFSFIASLRSTGYCFIFVRSLFWRVRRLLLGSGFYVFTVSLSFASHGATFCLRSYRRHYEVSLSFV